MRLTLFYQLGLLWLNMLCLKFICLCVKYDRFSLFAKLSNRMSQATLSPKVRRMKGANYLHD